MERLTLEESLRKAHALAEFQVHYQPQIDLRDGKVVGVEALLRWMSPELGPVSPAKFIPIAEDSGLIVDIGAFTLRVACEQLKVWKRQGRSPARVSVNVSLAQLKRGNLVTLVERASHDSGVSPTELELELTETTAMENSTEVAKTMCRLKEMGVRISVEDFGTGYSSPSYLKQLPLDVLKIDRSFVQDLPESEDSAAITSAIIAMARRLSLSVVAEGVETEAQRRFLLDNGCDVMRGYLVSPPLPADEVEALFDQRCFAASALSDARFPGSGS